MFFVTRCNDLLSTISAFFHINYLTPVIQYIVKRILDKINLANQLPPIYKSYCLQRQVIIENMIKLKITIASSYFFNILLFIVKRNRNSNLGRIEQS